MSATLAQDAVQAGIVGNAQWQERKDAAMARGEGNLAPIFIDRAEGSQLWDVEGRRYLDFGTGIAVVNTGHLHPKVKSAVARQLDGFQRFLRPQRPRRDGAVT